MTETRSISMGSPLFNLEVPAFDRLQTYLDALRRVLRGTEGEEDILQEVEHRLAELLQARLGGRDRALTLSEVESACAQLGDPEEFGAPEAEHINQDAGGAAGDGPKTGRRLFRDPDERILAGVASGIGHRFSVDPVIIRCIFVALFFLTGTGPLFYIVLAAIMPKARTASDRLAMKGDAVTVSAIRKTVEEQMQRAKEGLQESDVAGRFGRAWRQFVHVWLPSFLKRIPGILGWIILSMVILLLVALGFALLIIVLTGRTHFSF